MISGIIFNSCTFLGLRVYAPTPKLSIDRYQSKLSDKPVLYCSYSYSEYHNTDLCHPLVFFSDGSILSGELLEDFQKVSDYFSREKENLYGKNDFGWGRYVIEKDTIRYEWAQHYKLGLINKWFPVVKKQAVFISEDSLYVTIAPNNKRTPFLLSDSLYYQKIDYPDINNIDPSKAWINQK